MAHSVPQTRSKRWMLILLICIGQFACLIIGAMWFANRLGSDFGTLMRDEVLANNAHMANQMAYTINELNLKDITVESPDWQKLQALVEHTHLPNDGYVSVIDDRLGQVLCHPRWHSQRYVQGLQVGQIKLHNPDGSRKIINSVVSGNYVSLGWARVNGEEQLLAVRSVPSLGIMILAHQKEAPLLIAISRIVTSIKSAGLAVAVALVAVSLFFIAGVIERYESRMTHVQDHIDELADEKSETLLATRHAVIFELAKMAELRDSKDREHLDRVRAYTEILCKELAGHDASLSEDVIGMIGLTSCLHDIGNSDVPQHILLKPGELTDHERSIMQKHTQAGGDLLLGIRQTYGCDPFIDFACEIALAHHERWDGQGYPFGLSKDNIPLPARIVALADVYDALTSERVYNKPANHAEARKIILVSKERQFDPAVVDAFLATEGQFKTIAADAQFNRLKKAHPPIEPAMANT